MGYKPNRSLRLDAVKSSPQQRGRHYLHYACQAVLSSSLGRGPNQKVHEYSDKRGGCSTLHVCIASITLPEYLYYTNIDPIPTSNTTLKIIIQATGRQAPTAKHVTGHTQSTWSNAAVKTPQGINTTDPTINTIPNLPFQIAFSHATGSRFSGPYPSFCSQPQSQHHQPHCNYWLHPITLLFQTSSLDFIYWHNNLSCVTVSKPAVGQ